MTQLGVMDFDFVLTFGRSVFCGTFDESSLAQLCPLAPWSAHRVKITPEVKKEGEEVDELEETFKLSVGRLQRRWCGVVWRS